MEPRDRLKVEMRKKWASYVTSTFVIEVLLRYSLLVIIHPFSNVKINVIVFLELYCQYHSLILKHFHHPKKKPHACLLSFPIPISGPRELLIYF